MLLHRKSGQRIDLTNKVRATRTLEALGFSCTNANPGWYYDGSVYRQAAANTCRFTSEGGRTGLLSEVADTNVVHYSSENNAVWVVSNATKAASGTSCIDGKTPIKVTATTTAGYISQATATMGTFIGSDETFYIIVEKGDSTVQDIAIWDSTAGAAIDRVRLTFATGAVSTISGAPISSYAYRINETGPNGGSLWYLVVTSTTVGGNNREIRAYPDPLVGTKYNWIHHFQFVERPHASSPLVTAGGSASRDGDVISSTTVPSWWSNSQVTVISRFERIFETDDVGALFVSSDGSPNNYVLLFLNASLSNEAAASAVIGGAGVTVISAQALARGSINKAAVSAKDTATYAAGGGAASANGSQAGVPADATRFDIGQALGALYWLDGRIFDITIRPVAMSDTELAANT